MNLEKELLRIKNYCHLIDIPLEITQFDNNYLLTIPYKNTTIDLRKNNINITAIFKDEYGQNIISGSKVSQGVITGIIENVTNEG